MSLRHCPSEYYEHCLNAAALCLRCAAGYGNPQGKVYYAPREADSPPVHPYLGVRREQERQKRQERQQRTQTRRERVQKARIEEERARQSLIRATVNSGAKYGDGDYKVTDWLHCDHKHRQKVSKQFTLTLAEYEKGVAQGVESWIITIHPQEGQTLRGVFLTEAAFGRLLREAGVTLRGLDCREKD
jgi:hypothetical protein